VLEHPGRIVLAGFIRVLVVIPSGFFPSQLVQKRPLVFLMDESIVPVREFASAKEAIACLLGFASKRVGNS